MATFVWDPAVRWPPPANILLNYDVVPPDPPTVQARDAPDVLHTFLPIHDALRVSLVDRDGSSPIEEKTPMAKVVFVGDLYSQDPQVGGGPMPGGGGPVDPGYGRPGWSPVDPGYGRPGGPHISTGPIYGGGHPSGQPVYPGGPTDPGYGRPGWSPTDPGYGRPGWSPVDPGWGVGGGGGSTLPVLPPISAPPRPWDPPAGSEIPDPPADIADEVVIAVWNPQSATWSVATAPAAQPKA
jgi:hypothetical protein